MIPRRAATILLTTVMLALCVPADAEGASRRRTRKSAPKQPQSVENVRREQTRAQKVISETAQKIDRTNEELNRRMGQLNSLNADIETQTATVNRLRSHVDSIGGQIRLTSDSIAILERDLEGLRRSYAKAMARLQPSAGSLDAINFLFSSSSFSEAWSRLRYLRRFASWRENKAAEINRAVDRIASRRQHLTSLRHTQDVERRRAEEQQRVLRDKQDQSRQLVASLRKEDSRLRAQLKEQQRKAAALDRQLDRLIAEEQQRIAREEAERKKKEQREAEQRRKAAKAGKTSPAPKSPGKGADTPSAAEVASSKAVTKKAAATSPSSLTGSFAQNKGRMLFPVGGSYKIVRRFGRQPHPTLSHVWVDNSGIDIETGAGSSARAVFGGTVSAIFRQDGYGSIVMLRHGSYVTVYAGLSSVAVSQGQEVKAGQTIGTIARAAGRDVSELHFEVRNERTKLNPTAWVR